MKFKCVETVRHPLPQVWAAMRDHLPDIAAAQDDIAYVKVEKRNTKDPKATHVLSTWCADPPIPGFLKSFIKPDMLIWTDDATWYNDETLCHFNITPNYQVEEIHCQGQIAFAADGAKTTIVTYSGELTIRNTERSSIFIETNFDKVVKGAEKYMKAKR
jgi:hypothetical protein